MTKNLLYYGDNLQILHDYIKDETVDLIYLDPPFKSNQDYNVLFAEQNGSRSAAQIKAFKDTWRWDTTAAAAYRDIVERGGKPSQVMQAFHTFLGETDMLAYLAMMAPRLVDLHRVLKPSGSIYLHCDQTASAHLRLLMDAVFGPNNFRNEIVWSYKRYTAVSARFQRLHDIILFYGKSDKTAWNEMREEYGSKSGTADSHYKQDKEGRWYRWQKRKGKEPYKIYLSEGRRMGDVWEIPHINASSRERLGYPTQKPEALLERIIKASSKKGYIILDPFCGCGTTIAMAEKLNRHWIGIDITHLAIALMRHRIEDMFGEKIRMTYQVVGEPVSLPDAKTLAANDPYQFQWWALELVGARPVEQKKGADKGIDGRLYFHDEPDSSKAKTKQIIISVKAGHTGPTHVRDLRGVIERENAAIGVFICMQKPTKPMRTEAASGGFYKSPWQEEPYPRLQILTIEELLTGKRIDCPPLGQVNVTFKKAPKAKGKATKQPELEYPQE